MHPGYQNPDYLGPAGPVDSELSVLSLRTLEGIPICVFANYSMHYVGGVRAAYPPTIGDTLPTRCRQKVSGV